MLEHGDSPHQTVGVWWEIPELNEDLYRFMGKASSNDYLTKKGLITRGLSNTLSLNDLIWQWNSWCNTFACLPFTNDFGLWPRKIYKNYSSHHYRNVGVSNVMFRSTSPIGWNMHHFTKIGSMEHSNSQTPQNKHMQRANPHLAVTYQIGNQPQNHEVKSPWSPISAVETGSHQWDISLSCYWIQHDTAQDYPMGNTTVSGLFLGYIPSIVRWDIYMILSGGDIIEIQWDIEWW